MGKYDTLHGCTHQQQLGVDTGSKMHSAETKHQNGEAE